MLEVFYAVLVFVGLSDTILDKYKVDVDNANHEKVESVKSEPNYVSTVILLPDTNGKVGEVFISTEHNNKILNKAYTQVQVTSSDSALVSKSVSKKILSTNYKNVLDARPKSVSSYQLFFQFNKNKLTQSSYDNLLPMILKDIRSRKYFDAVIIGHTDTMGDKDKNLSLGLERAEKLKRIFKLHSTDNKGTISIHSLGEGNLLVPSDDNKKEAKNRRVEIEIR